MIFRIFGSTALALAFVIWCLFVAQIIREGRSRYIHNFCPNASDSYCPQQPGNKS
jgi:hypothetical protein